MFYKKQTFFIVFVLLVYYPLTNNLAIAQPDKENRPNILLIMADDATYNDLPLYGGENVATPRIDELSEQGITFNNAYISASMCVPARAALYTGLYPARNGVAWNHSPARTGTKSVVQYLRDLNYRVGIAGKVHASPESVFPFEMVEGVERGAVAKTAGYEEADLRKFMERDDEQPFFLSVSLTSPHAPWTVGEPENFNIEELELPPYLADTEDTRKDFARYLAEIEVMDRQVGKTLDILEEVGKAENTIVIFSSEQGSQFPGAKWTNWNPGVHTALIVRWPDIVQKDQRTDAMVQYVDILPTLLEAGGERINEGQFDGSSFLAVLKGETNHHRDYAYFMHNNVPEGPPYPIRAVTNGIHHYIRNLNPNNMYIEKHLMGTLRWHIYWPSWIYNSTQDEHTYQVTQRYLYRSAEELYNTEKDPNHLNNLIQNPRMSKIKEELSITLDEWMLRQGDPGAAIDTWKELEAAREENHFSRF